jgi:serine/threonine-protein kinase
MPPGNLSHAVLLEPGVIFGDRFRLDAEIGRGGMALVFAARDLELDEEVALKVFSGQLVTREWLQDAVARFREELRVCRKLRHPNIIQVYDIGIHGGHRYFTMELLRGQSLHSLLGQPLPLAPAVSYLIQACNGLQAAHERGVVHRDVKPENIFITHEGVVKIMDFGIAKSSQNRGQTAVGTLAGTPEYMAPEQITGFSSVGPAADQYALGIVAYQMLTGDVPFAHEEIMPLLMMQREQLPTPLRQLNPSVPESIEAIVMRMLAKEASARFESCAAVARHLAGSF